MDVQSVASSDLSGSVRARILGTALHRPKTSLNIITTTTNPTTSTNPIISSMSNNNNTITSGDETTANTISSSRPPYSVSLPQNVVSYETVEDLQVDGQRRGGGMQGGNVYIDAGAVGGAGIVGSAGAVGSGGAVGGGGAIGGGGGVISGGGAIGGRTEDGYNYVTDDQRHHQTSSNQYYNSAITPSGGGRRNATKQTQTSYTPGALIQYDAHQSGERGEQRNKYYKRRPHCACRECRQQTAVHRCKHYAHDYTDSDCTLEEVTHNHHYHHQQQHTQSPPLPSQQPQRHKNHSSRCRCCNCDNRENNSHHQSAVDENYQTHYNYDYSGSNNNNNNSGDCCECIDDDDDDALLRYQNDEEYSKLVDELEEKLVSRNRARVRRTMDEFERRSSQHAANSRSTTGDENNPDRRYRRLVTKKGKWQLDPRTGEWIKVTPSAQTTPHPPPPSTAKRSSKMDTPTDEEEGVADDDMLLSGGGNCCRCRRCSKYNNY